MKLLTNSPFSPRHYSHRINPYGGRISECSGTHSISEIRFPKYIQALAIFQTSIRGNGRHMEIRNNAISSTLEYLLYRNPEHWKVNRKVIDSVIENFVFEEPYGTNRRYLYYTSYKTFHKASIYKGLVDGTDNYAFIVNTNEVPMAISKGIISIKKPNHYLINPCLNIIDSLANMSNLFSKEEVIAGFMFTREDYLKHRLKLLKEGSIFDYDYDKLKFFIDPALLERNPDIPKIGNFLKKYVFPKLDELGVEIIEESPNKYFNTPETSYGTNNLLDFFDKRGDKAINLFKENIPTNIVSLSTVASAREELKLFSSKFK